MRNQSSVMKKRFFRIAVMLLAAMLAVVGSQQSVCMASTYYASPTGSGNGLSTSTPMSWSQGLSKLQSGDSLYLLGGTYSLSDKQNIAASKSGTSTKRTFIGAYPEHKPVFDFRSQPYGKEETGHDNQGVSISSGAEYIHIKGLTIRYAGKNGLINFGSYCLFEALDVYGCGDSGIQMKGGGNNTILNCDSHDNFDYKLGDITASDFGGNADGFADKQFEGPGNHYIGCRAWNNSDDGWDFFQRVSTSQTVIEHCVCYANGPATYDMRNHARYEKDKAWFDQFAGSGIDVTDADANTVHVSLDEYANMGNGNGFKLGGKDTEHNVSLNHCLAVSNTVKGFDQNNNAGVVYLYNNTAYDNGTNYGFGKENGCKLYIRNCIGMNTHNPNSFKVAVVNEYNTWNGIQDEGSSFLSKDKSLILAARNADGSLAETAFLHLREGSKLIDAGINVGLDYKGLAPDLGCYESEFSGGEESDLVLTDEMWNMSDADFKSLGTITEEVPVRKLHLEATSEATMVVDGSMKSVDGYDFTHRLKMSGTGTSNSRHVWFEVKGDCAIDVYVASANSEEERTMSIAAGVFSNVVKTLPAVIGTPAKQHYEYKGAQTRIYIYSANKPINIYGIKLTYGGTSTEVDQVPSDQVPSTKVMENGVLYIKYNGTMYNVMGTAVSR